MDKHTPIPPASRSLTATLGGGTTLKAHTEHKAVEKAEGVVKEAAPPAVLLKRGDIVKDLEKDIHVTVLRPYIASGILSRISIHEVVNAKTGEKWLQWETNLKKR